MITPGEEKAWESLSVLDPSGICRNASVAYDEVRHSYIVRSFCYDFSVSPEDRIISPHSPQGANLIRKYPYFFIHSCLWYLIHAKDIAETGRLARPGDKPGESYISGAAMFFPSTALQRDTQRTNKPF